VPYLDATQVVEILCAGLVMGCLYALVAQGYSLIYSVMGFINFAHGEMMVFGAYVALAVGGLGIPFLPAALAAILATGLLARLSEIFFFGPARKRGSLAPLVVGIGLSLALQSLMGLVFSNEDARFFPVFSGKARLGLSFLPLTVLDLVIIGLVPFLWLAVSKGFLRRTEVGITIRAVASNPDRAQELGLNTRRCVGAVFVLAGAFAALAGILLGVSEQVINPTIGFSFGLRAFAASVVGGLRSYTGAILGAVLLGLVESAALICNHYIQAIGMVSLNLSKDTIALTLLVVVLLIRPHGLFSPRREVRP
jgi:branched-chain amino acid transport system permease protein